MFSLQNRTIKRLTKRAGKTIDSWKKKNDRDPLMRDIQKIGALAISDRIAFVIVGGIFLWVSYLFIQDNSWTFPSIFVPIAGYVTVRGFIGHSLRIKSMDEDMIATPEGIVTSIDNDLTKVGRALLTLDICFAILLIIVEIVFAVLGGIASSLS